jgi:hypothetical protein
MLIIDHSVFTKASAEQVWKLYKDPTTWPIWDHEIEYASLKGPFAIGTKGILRPRGGPEVKFVIIEMIPKVKFSDISLLPLTKLKFTHTLTKKSDKLEINHRVEMWGLLSFFFAFVIGRKIKAGLPTAMKKLAEVAENSDYAKK